MATSGWENISASDLNKLGRSGRSQVKSTPTASKYRNVRYVIDSLTFDSKREAHYYVGLKARADRGDITDLRIQVSFPLFCPAPDRRLTAIVGHYIADFVYYERGVRHVVDVKGIRTQIFKLKAKWIELQEGFLIECV